MHKSTLWTLQTRVETDGWEESTHTSFLLQVLAQGTKGSKTLGLKE